MVSCFVMAKNVIFWPKKNLKKGTRWGFFVLKI